jgi:hypothetical protein
MSLSDLASLGSFVSGVAVLVSVIYLAIQVRQNTRNLRAQNAIAHFQMVANMNEIGADPRYSNLFAKGMRGDSGIEQGEYLQFAYLMRTFVTNFYTEWLLDRETLLHRGTYSSQRSLYTRFGMGQPGMRAWWRTYGSQFPTEFRAEIDGVIKETKLDIVGDMGFAVWKSHLAQELASG